MIPWDEAVDVFRAQAYATMEADPQILLEVDGGPVGMKADVVLARLIGHDGQIDADIRIPEARAEWLMPIMPRLSFAVSEADALHPTIQAAEYVLQSGYVQMRVDWGVTHPKDIKPGPDFSFSVLFLRYRRKLG